VSERNLRPSVIFRKVTNGFRFEWGAETYAAFRSVVSTAKANQTAVLRVIRKALLTPPLSILGVIIRNHEARFPIRLSPYTLSHVYGLKVHTNLARGIIYLWVEYLGIKLL